jgi:chemotaxis protein methyltransferase CheR
MLNDLKSMTLAETSDIGNVRGKHFTLTGIDNEISERDMSDAEFIRFGDFIQGQCGIKMPLSKKTMLQGRLQKRLRVLQLPSFSAYADFLFSTNGMEEEILHMIDAVTTNKTDFFRESNHFDYLTSIVLPEIINTAKISAGKHIKAWSAGCSTGEEPYTLAMVISQFIERNPSVRFSILATDISTKVLQNAQMGIYQEEKIAPVPMDFRQKYLLRSKDKSVVRIVPELRSCVQFMRLNFMNNDFGLRDMMDIIFCRNVIIYFDRPTQEIILQRICRHLTPGGYLFMGHSETLNGMELPLTQVSASIYRR